MSSGSLTKQSLSPKGKLTSYAGYVVTKVEMVVAAKKLILYFDVIFSLGAK